MSDVVTLRKLKEIIMNEITRIPQNKSQVVLKLTVLAIHYFILFKLRNISEKNRLSTYLSYLLAVATNQISTNEEDLINNNTNILRLTIQAPSDIMHFDPISRGDMIKTAKGMFKKLVPDFPI